MRTVAENWLREVLGAEGSFRAGQWEAIEALVSKRQRILVVQRTGWGKSLVYFVATRLLRAQGAGTTLLISPLLSLMRNQLQAGAAWGLCAETLNSSNPEDHARIEASLLANEVDLLLISPERLANDAFQRNVWTRLKSQVGLVVIDEAHCISDWGHDFRPNYRRIMRLLDDLSPGTPVLGTTATANDRVVADVSEIIGAGINIQRGPLTRESLSLYVYPDPMDIACRLTLLTHLMQHIPGNGIIYCATTRDCMLVAGWLQLQGFNVKPYFADVEEELTESRATLETQLLNNEVKALVSSVALGMGFDKPDLHFVIHYQMPGNIISYYQQIGRAGRGIDRAHIVLMHGPEDEEIQKYFIETAFPKPQQVRDVVEALKQSGAATRNRLQQMVNVRYSALEKILTHLEVDQIIENHNSEYRLVNAIATPDFDRWEAVTQRRYAELAQMQAYAHHPDCLMNYIARALDDPVPVEKCRHCKNCRGSQSKFQPNPQDIEVAQRYLRDGRLIMFEPRKRYPAGLAGVTKSAIPYSNETGIALCNYYGAGWGEQVRSGPFVHAHYSDELVEAAARLLKQLWQSAGTAPTWVTAVPSLRRPSLVPDFARRLALALELPYLQAVEQVALHPEQRAMQNSHQQAANVRGKYTIAHPPLPGPVLLVDDIVDTRWTLTIVGELLRQHRSGRVYPFALASTNTE